MKRTQIHLCALRPADGLLRFCLEMRLTCLQPFEERLTSDEPKIYLFSRLCPFTSSHARMSHPQIYLSTSIHLHICMTPAHPHCHSFTSILLSFFSTVLDNHMSRSRATRRLVIYPHDQRIHHHQHHPHITRPPNLTVFHAASHLPTAINPHNNARFTGAHPLARSRTNFWFTRHTLWIGCTELKAAPLASLRNQILKNQVRGPERL